MACLCVCDVLAWFYCVVGFLCIYGSRFCWPRRRGIHCQGFVEWDRQSKIYENWAWAQLVEGWGSGKDCIFGRMTERTLRIRHGLQQKFAQELQSGKEFDFKIGNDWHRVEQ